jgi:Fungal specific transcription factor domain
MGVAEMELLHHYSTSTCYTISRLPVLQTVWRIKVPQCGFSSPFVLRSILALSALHLAHLKPELQQYYVGQAELHHNIALQQVSSIIPGINEENAPALCLFSTITSIISCAKPRSPDDFWVIGNRDIEWLTLFRGTRFIVAASNTIKTGILSPIFNNGHRRSCARNARSTANLTYLDDLRQLLVTTVTDARELNCYFEAINDMAKSFATIEEEGPQNCQTADVFVWLLQISNEYLLLLHQRKPEALVIFSYFCVITHTLEWAWWMQGLSVHLIRGIYSYLEDEYRCWLQWPMEQLGWVP